MATGMVTLMVWGEERRTVIPFRDCATLLDALITPTTFDVCGAGDKGNLDLDVFRRLS